MIDILDMERHMLQNRSLSKSDVRISLQEEREYDFDEESYEKQFESEINDRFKKIRCTLKIFGEAIYTISSDNEVIDIADGFMADAECKLCIHCMDIASTHSNNELSRLFETIAAEALCALFGRNSAHKLCDRVKFPDFSITKLASTMGEPFGRELKNDKHAQEGDGCCDVVFWKKGLCASQTPQKGLLLDRARIVTLLAKKDNESTHNLRIAIDRYLSEQ